MDCLWRRDSSSIDRPQPAGKGQLTIQEFLNGVGQNVAEKDKVD